jgi:hypothetical protein
MSAKDCRGHFAAFFGKPPTTASEDPEQYKALRGRMAAVVEPAKALLELPQRVLDPSGHVLEKNLIAFVPAVSRTATSPVRPASPA